MYHSFTPSRKLFVFALLAVAFTACRRDKDHDNNAGNYIAASEKLGIPPSVQVPTFTPGGTSRVATYYAVGVQLYKAVEKGPVFEWIFVAPKAKLYDAAGRKVGTHGAGPFWEISAADSLFAQQFSPSRTAPSPSPGNIDWLLLMPRLGKNPTGIFAEVDFIQRIATVGGLAPAAPPKHANETVEVPYEAVYRFTKINS